MNIPTSKLSAQSGVVNITKTAAPEAAKEKEAEAPATAPQESFTPEAEGEGRMSAAWRGGVRKGVSWGETLEKPLGGMTAIGLAIGSGLALSLGGAMVGGLPPRSGIHFGTGTRDNLDELVVRLGSAEARKLEASAAVCDRAASEPAAVRPPFQTRTGFRATAARSERSRRRPSRTPSI